MHKFYFYIIFILLFTGCQSESNEIDKSQRDTRIPPKENTIESYHYKCTTEKLYFYCKALAFLYEEGGLHDGKRIKKDPIKAKEYYKILCEEYKKDFFCENKK